MGTTGAEGFGSSFHGFDMEDAGEDETIRRKDGETGHNDIGAHHNENYQITDVDTCARELEQRKDITEIMVDGFCMTEGQSQHASSVTNGTRKCHQVGTKHKVVTHFRGYNNMIQKWFTDGHIHLYVYGHTDGH